ncbi:hypothetical protein KBZ10_04025 [Streptomyces sp. F63]|uniref:PA14 domain-containing protein n=1 Tax=Streptomyces sp. F63 TaxID=2824887 RepID=UPI001B37DBE6|nr:PA14 domain-containing protein [Streptomyces sp. F63]MBQ0983703.1 hypothetical protein [Streptomyces sp. F63]
MTPARPTTAPGRPRTAAALAAGVVLATTGSMLTAPTAEAALGAPTTATAARCASLVYKRQFYANTTFSGAPARTDCDSRISQDWGTGAPASGLPSNYFGVRWTVTRDFGSGGPFSFPVESRDGIRVYLDGVRKVDIWKNVSTTQKKTVNVTIPSGEHTLRIDFVNWTGTANVKFDYLPRTSADVDKVAPLAPTGFTAAYDASTARTKLAWSKNKEMDLKDYRVYRRRDSTTTWSYLATTTATSYTDTPPATGETYHYRIRAIDKARNRSAPTAGKSVTTADRTAPAAPIGVEDNWNIGLTTTVKLSWDSNSEADLAGYRVYRSTTRPVALTEANLVSGPEPIRSSWFTETPPPTGDWAYYVVTAVDSHGNESPASGTAEFQTWDKTAPVFVPDDFTAVDGERGVSLSWSWDRAQDRDLSDFEVYRDGTHIGSASGAFEDTTVKRSTTYTYWVRAVDESGNLGPASDKITVDHIGDYTAPGPVTGLTATPVENGVRLDWDDSPAPDFDHYEVHRGTHADGQWSYTELDSGSREGLQSGSIWSENLHKTLPDGEHVRYAVVAVDKDGNALAPGSGDTDMTEVTELDMRPAEATPDGGPVGWLAAQDFQLSGVDLRWGYSPETDPSGTAATGFHIYRWNPSEGAYVRLTGTPLDADAWDYSDTAAPDNSTLYYRITVVYADGTESAPTGDHVLT